jgi:hypothetical protein
MLELVVAMASIARDVRVPHLKSAGVVARSAPALNGSARYTRAGHNKSLDRSGVRLFSIR